MWTYDNVTCKHIRRNAMGYTHYFSHEATTQDKWAAIVKDCETLRQNLPDSFGIAGGDGTGDPVFNNDEIVFNGLDSVNESHETFAISRGGAVLRSYMDKDRMPFAFCKTAHKPYDVLVCACLLAYKHHSPNTMELSSDGDSEEWEEAENLVYDVLGYSAKYKDLGRKQE